MKPIPLALTITTLISASSLVQAGGSPDSGFTLDVADLYSVDPSGGLTLADDSLRALAAAGPAPAAGLTTAVAPMTLGADGDKGSYVTAKLGPLWFIEDLEDLDVGLNFEVAFGSRLLSILALEFQTGYFWGEDGPVDFSGAPFVLNAKVILPIFFLEAYGGLGVGGYYVNIDFPGGDEDDFVFGGNVFLGAGLDIGPVGVGLEGKYIVTDEFDAPGGEELNFQGFALMAYVTLQF